MAKTKTVEEQFKALSEVEHILLRPGMWLGSIKEEQRMMFLYNVDNAQMEMREATYIPAMLKVVDEIISNSCDEYRRETNMGLTNLDVTINDNGWIKVRDNGGIPIVVHKDAGCYVPEFIFGRLRTSSNYDDTEDRDVIGTNGVGSSLCNIWSKRFIIRSADKKKSFSRSWSDNMQTLNDDLEVKVCRDHYTESEFLLDYDRFDCETKGVTADFVDIIEKRCIDAAVANSGLVVTFRHMDGDAVVREKVWEFKTFDEYIDLYNDYIDRDNAISFSDKQKQVWIYPDGNINIGFVNGAECSKGTHIRAVRNAINDAVCEELKSKKKIDIGSPKNVDNKYSMFCNFKVSNPAYSSQTKEELTTPVERFEQNNPNYRFDVPQTFLNSVCRSEILNIVVDWYKQKCEVEDQKTLRKLNKQAKTKVRNNDKFIDANSRNARERELWIFEGDSARSGFRTARNPQTQAAYMLRGVPLNTIGLTPSKIMDNRELSDIITILGLQWGQRNDVSKLNFGKIVIATDADFDGSKIAGLMLNFFNLFPELFEARMVCRSITPIITAIKGGDIKRYYKIEDFKKAEDSLKGYKVIYNKGLGGLTQVEYKDMMQHPLLQFFGKDEFADNTFKLWFGKDGAGDRKNTLKSEV